MDIMSLYKDHVAPTYSRFPVELVSGRGSTLYDASGKPYIDLGSGIAVNIFGAQDAEWTQAVIDQLQQIQHTSNLYYTRPQAQLAQLLCEKTGMSKVFFGNSGAEANECAIKAARKYNADLHGEDVRPVIVTLNQSFHGRTLATLAATGQESFHKHFGPFPQGFVHVDANDIDAMRSAFYKYPVGAVMIELVQGEGGVVPLDADYVREVYELCQSRDVLLIVDEVQTGNGRTGTLYAFEQFGIKPDILTTAKGLGGGLPIGACLLSEKLQDTLGPGTHGSTFGGNPVCAAGAVSILQRIDTPLLQGVMERHEMILSALGGAKGVKGVSGLGLMLGVACERPAADVVRDCLEGGVLLLTAKDKVRLLPALNIPIEALTQALDILKEALAK